MQSELESLNQSLHMANAKAEKAVAERDEIQTKLEQANSEIDRLKRQLEQ